MTTQRPREPQLAGEMFAAAELAALMTDPLYYGVGAPRGDGRPAVVLPGMFANDWYLRPLRTWLSRIGYRAVRSTLAMNVGCPQRLTEQVEAELGRHRRDGQPAILIGHSRGGMLARVIAVRLGRECSHLVLLGSPVGALTAASWWPEARDVAHSRVAAAGLRARERRDPDCNVPYCGCPYPADFKRPLAPSTRVLSIYSRDDPVVPARACRIAGATNIEVSGTHSGLVYNRAAYRALAEFLKQ